MSGTRGALVKGGAVAVAFLAGTGLITGLLPNPLFDRMVPRTALDFAFLILTATLLGAYVVQRSRRPDCSGDACAYGGALGGFLAVACPHCNAILVALFSATWLSTYVDPLRPLVGALAVALVAGVIYRRR